MKERKPPLRLTASQGTSNIPFHWFLLLGSYRQAQKKTISLAEIPKEEPDEEEIPESPGNRRFKLNDFQECDCLTDGFRAARRHPRFAL